MNRLILALIISCGLTACSNNGTKKSASTDVEQTQPQEQKDRVEVLYFHSKQRCATCMAIEKNAKEAVEAEFADELKTGTLSNGTVENYLGAFPSRRTKLSPRNTRLHGLRFSSANGKPAKKRMKI